MQVKTKSDKSVVVGEMTTYEEELGSIAEMITDATRLDQFVPGASIKGAQLAQATKDDSPEFPVVRVEEGWSGSRRLWTAKEVEGIAAQVNSLQPVGHLGHIKDEDESTAMPPPQTTWFAATTKVEPSRQKDRIGEMVTAAYFAGYNLPGASIRTLIPAKAVRGVSWWGRGEQVSIPGKGVEVRGFKLKALDWARKLAEGMPSSSVVAVTGEQETTNMAKELAQVTPEEFESENPLGYRLLVEKVTRDKDKTIAEMQTKVDEGETAKGKLKTACEALGIDDPEKLLDAISDLTNRLGAKAKVTLDTALDKLLTEKVADDQTRALVRRLLPVSEMEAKVADAKPEDAEKIIGEMVTESFDKDETIKTLIGEQTPPVVRRREDLSRGGSNTDAKLKTYGVERERVTFST